MIEKSARCIFGFYWPISSFSKPALERQTYQQWRKRSCNFNLLRCEHREFKQNEPCKYCTETPIQFRNTFKFRPSQNVNPIRDPCEGVAARCRLKETSKRRRFELSPFKVVPDQRLRQAWGWGSLKILGCGRIFTDLYREQRHTVAQNRK